MLGKLFREIDKDRIGTTKQVDGLETIIHFDGKRGRLFQISRLGRKDWLVFSSPMW
jgi:hypothetical protein